jgi:hypothetical protein
VLWGRGLVVGLITRPEEYYWLWCVIVCDLETSWMRSPWPNWGCRANNKQTDIGRDVVTYIGCNVRIGDKPHRLRR